jgi:hypothetical protein
MASASHRYQAQPDEDRPETLTSVLTKPGELGRFLELVAERVGDPSAATCQVFERWDADDGNLIAYFDGHERVLKLGLPDGDGVATMALPISEDLSPQIDENGIRAFGLRKVCSGVWALAPSLNLPGIMHAFVVFHGVPDPAPWESLIILVSV